MSWIVKIAYKSKYPNPIHFQVGDSVEIGIQDEEFPGWIWVITADGNQGWAPIQYLQIDTFGKNAIAFQEYSAKELNTRTGELLVLFYEFNGWGWVENEHKETGWVPLSSIKRMDISDESTDSIELNGEIE
jgi:hypothetical protein